MPQPNDAGSRWQECHLLVQDWDSSQSQQQASTTIYWTSNVISEGRCSCQRWHFGYSDNPNKAKLIWNPWICTNWVMPLFETETEKPSVMAPILDFGLTRRTLYPSDASYISVNIDSGKGQAS